MDAVIEVKNLIKTYGTLTAVDHLSFTVAPGEIFGVVGPNGAGKTTTVECLMGMRRADSGEISVLGLDPQRDESALRQRIGVQLQQASLPDDVRVWEALDLFASFYKKHVNWQDLLDVWGLAEKKNSRFAQLSGGQRQRLFIAMSLVNDPELVFLDELTTGLDPQSRRSTWEMIAQLRERGKTVILVTHFMEEAEKLCDRVAIIDRGKLIALDTPKKLIQGLNLGTRLSFSYLPGMELDWMRAVPGVSAVERVNGSVLVSGSGPLLSRLASGFVEHGIDPADLRTEQPNLEDVFLAMTGRKIRE